MTFFFSFSIKDLSMWSLFATILSFQSNQFSPFFCSVCFVLKVISKVNVLFRSRRWRSSFFPSVRNVLNANDRKHFPHSISVVTTQHFFRENSNDFVAASEDINMFLNNRSEMCLFGRTTLIEHVISSRHSVSRNEQKARREKTFTSAWLIFFFFPSLLRKFSSFWKKNISSNESSSKMVLAIIVRRLLLTTAAHGRHKNKKTSEERDSSNKTKT